MHHILASLLARFRPVKQERKSRVQISPQNNVESLEQRLCLSAAAFLPAQAYAVVPTPHTIALADFNGDGRPDMAVTVPEQNLIEIRLNSGSGTFGLAHFLGFGTAISVVAADFNGDGKVDLAVTGRDAAHNAIIGIFFGNGDGTFSRQPVIYHIATGGQAMATADLNGDGFSDLVVTAAHSIAVLMNQGNGTFSAATYYRIGGGVPEAIALTDLNNDGLPDIALAGGAHESISILMNLKSAPGTFGLPTVIPINGLGDPVDIVAGDLNNDGNADLAVVSSGFNVPAVNVLLGNGDGTFRPTVAYGGPQFADTIAIGDFSGNGNQDLVVGSFDGPLQVYSGNGDGTLAVPQNLFTASFTQNVQVADLNGDGLPDIVTVPFGIKVLLNNSGAVPPSSPPIPSDVFIGAGNSRSFSFHTLDGALATISIQGPGTVDLNFGNSATVIGQSGSKLGLVPVIGRALSSISTTGTTQATTLTITTQFRSQTLTVPSITADSLIGAIIAPSAKVTGAVSLPGGARYVQLLSANDGSISIGAGPTATLIVGQTSNETITSAAPVAQLRIGLDASMNLTAPSVTAMTIGGSLINSRLTFTAPFAADVMDLGRLTVGRNINNVAISSAGSVGTVIARTMVDSSLYVGVGTLQPGQVFPALADFISPATLQSVQLQTTKLAPSFANSVITAFRENSLSLGTIQVDNGGTPFGVAANTIGAIAGSIPAQGKTFVLTSLNSATTVAAQVAARKLTLQDFTIQIDA